MITWCNFAMIDSYTKIRIATMMMTMMVMMMMMMVVSVGQQG